MKRLLFLLIILLALTLRLYNLDKVPPSLFGDEVDVGYQAYSLLTTGKDLRGHFLPFYIQSLYEYRTPAYIYSAVPFIAIFGLNEWGVRIPSVFWGVLSIVGLFFLVQFMFNKPLALATAFLMTISPWHIQYSRGSFEVTMLLTLLIFGTYFFLIGFKKGWFYLLSAFCFGLTIYTYSTAVIFTPPLLVVLAILSRDQLLQHKKITICFLLLFMITLIPWFISLYKGESKSRFEGVSIFQDSILLDKINLSRKSLSYFSPDGEEVNINPVLEMLFHNKITVYTQVFSLNYLRSFSLDFLFGEGDPNFRHSIHEMGLLYLFEIPLIMLGLVILLQRKDKYKFVVLGWLALAPIPASLTSDGGFHATRLILMLPPLAMISGLGFAYVSSIYQKPPIKYLVGILAVLAIINITFYMHRYFTHYPVESWRWWHQGFKQAMLYMKEQEGGYQKLFFNDTYEPTLIRFLFWWEYPPLKAQKQLDADIRKNKLMENFEGMQLDNRYYFGSADRNLGVENFVKSDMLYLVSQQDEVGGDWNWSKNPPQNITVLKTIRNPLGIPIFYIVTGKNL